MARTPLTLAALATSAVSGLQVTGYRVMPPSSDEERVILTSSEGELIVQLPLTQAAEVHHSARVLGQSALTAGVREQLPFAAPRVLGITRSRDTRAIVTSYLQGDHFLADDLTADAALLDSIAHMLGAIHSIPRTAVVQQGLRVRSANDARLDAQALIERAQHTGLMPEVVRQHWSRLLTDAQLWDFQPVVIHGTVSEETLLLTDDAVSGVLDWSGLSIGDPASDFAWLAAAQPGVLEAVASTYADITDHKALATFVQRAVLWHELQIAEWLLHGIEQRNQEIIDDAIDLFDLLVSRLSAAPRTEPRPSNLESAAEAARPASVPDSFSDTASYDMLDEDRNFSMTREFPDDTAEAAEPDAHDTIQLTSALMSDAPEEEPTDSTTDSTAPAGDEPR